MLITYNPLIREKIEIEERKEQIWDREFVENISTMLQFVRGVGNELNFKMPLDCLLSEVHCLMKDWGIGFRFGYIFDYSLKARHIEITVLASERNKRSKGTTF